jgi:hypothetical protein
MEFTLLTKGNKEIIIPTEQVLPWMVDGWAFACNYCAEGAVLTGLGWHVIHEGKLIAIEDAIAQDLCTQMGPDERLNEERSLDDGELYEALGDQDADAE